VRRRHEQPLQQKRVSLARVHPIFGRPLVEDHRHPIVDFAYQRVRRAGHDRECHLRPLARRIPGLVQACEKRQAAGPRVDPERLALGLGPGPLVEAVGGYDAPALPEGPAEGGSLFERLRFGVDALAWRGSCLSPRG